MHVGKSISILTLVASAVACGQSPSAPSATTIGLVLNQQAATVPRDTTITLTAAAQSSTGATTDVTQAATWASSNDSVASVAGGVVSVKSLGTAQITASYDGRTTTATITARRRTNFDGKLTARDADGEASISGVGILLDQTVLATVGNSGYSPQTWITARGSDPQRPPISPGAHELSFLVDLKAGPHDVIALATTLKVYDADTGQLLTQIPLVQKRASSTSRDNYSRSVLVWTFTVPTFTQ